MIENKLEQQILQLYRKNLVNLFSINQISKELSKKYPYINKKVTELISQGILKKTIVGRSHLCSLNLASPKAVLLYALSNMHDQEKIPAIEKIREQINQLKTKVSILTALYYSGKIVIVLLDIRERREVDMIFREALVLDRNQFLELFVDDPSLFQNHVLLYGYEKFFELVNLAAEELKRRYSPLRY